MKYVAGFLHRQLWARPLATLSVFFLLGILAGDAGWLNIKQTVILSLAVTVLLVIFRIFNRHPHFLLPITLAFLLGILRMLAAFQLNPVVPEQFSIPFQGIVVSEPSLNESETRIICELKLTEMDGEPANYRVRLYLRSDTVALEGIEYGQTLSCFGHIWPQDPATNPYEYDLRNALRADGLSGMAAAKLEDVSITPSQPSLGRLRVRIRQIISDRIDLLFPHNADLVNAFVLGDRSGLSLETRDAFSQTGVAHLICISGLHISMLAMVILKLVNRFIAKKYAIMVTMGFVLIYGFLIGFPASLVRATIMFGIFSLGTILGEPSDPVTRITAALTFMLLIRPFWIYDGGFVLSFSASAGILLLTQPLSHLLWVDRLTEKKLSKKQPKRTMQIILRYFAQLLITTLAAQLATLPAVIAYFSAQSLISIPVNLIAIPLAMFAYPLALCALVISAIWIVPASWIAWISDGLFTLLIRLIHGFASLPAGEFRVPNFPIWLLALYCIGIVLASGLTRIPLKIRSLIPLGLILMCGISIFNAWAASLPFHVTFLDADQADAAVVRAKGHVYLFDVGDTYSPITDYVNGCCLSVDAVFLSHPHYDHAGGLLELLENITPKVIYVPQGWFDVESNESVQEGIDKAISMGIPVVELSCGDSLALTDDISVNVYGPDGSEETVNDLSLILELDYRGTSILFTGDLSAKGEPDELPDIDILKVPHHGSSKSTGESFLKKTTPSISIVSVGENNYGHPGSDTLDRLASSGSAIYRTDECGAITLSISPDGEINVQTYLATEASE